MHVQYIVHLLCISQEHDRQYMHIGTMVEFAFALVGKLDVINKHSFNDFKLRVGESLSQPHALSFASIFESSPVDNQNELLSDDVVANINIWLHIEDMRFTVCRFRLR